MAESTVNAFVRESHVRLKKEHTTVHSWFIRLVEPQTVNVDEIHDIYNVDCHLDLDVDGKLIGVHIGWIEDDNDDE